MVVEKTGPFFSHFCIIWAFLNAVAKERGGMLYFPSRLYNRDCIFSTFYHGYIYRGSRTVLVSLI